MKAKRASFQGTVLDILMEPSDAQGQIALGQQLLVQANQKGSDSEKRVFQSALNSWVTIEKIERAMTEKGLFLLSRLQGKPLSEQQIKLYINEALSVINSFPGYEAIGSHKVEEFFPFVASHGERLAS